MNEHLYWIGCRETEIDDCKTLFDGSITIFGCNLNGNRAFDQTYNLRYNYNQDNDLWNKFVEQKVQEICEVYPDARFMLYFPVEVSDYGAELPKHVICQNDADILQLLENKHRTRSWLSDTVPILPYVIQDGEHIDYRELCQMFPGYDRFVAQEVYSCGGNGTFMIEDPKGYKDKILPLKSYSISPYVYNSISPNIHMIIYAQDIIILPPSIQLFSDGNKRFHYNGADYVSYQYVPEHIKEKVRQYALNIGERLRFAGYRGVCGVDFLTDSHEVYLMEINARFQSSSFLLNMSLREIECPCSLQRLHLDAFESTRSSYKLGDLSVPYSFYSYSYYPQTKSRMISLYNLHKLSAEVICLDDNLNWNMTLKAETYLFKSIFTGNISSISPEFRILLHSNIDIAGQPETVAAWNHENAVYVKIMLLNHGVRISDKALQVSKKNGELNFKEFEALDIIINNETYVNVPYRTNRADLSPFIIKASPTGQYQLFYWDTFIADIALRYADRVGNNTTDNGFLYSDIAYLGNDRLRIYHRAGCFFKETHSGCKFCDIENTGETYTADDYKEVLDAYGESEHIRHYLIGGGSKSPSDDFQYILDMAQYIKDTFHKPIYLMSLPPINTSILLKLKEAGITEVAFNLEVFDRKLAVQYMPGKGNIPLTTYEAAFSESVRLWGRSGNVRTIFIIGLEPKESLLNGIEWVCKLGVSPILVLFKPIEGTPLSHMIAPSDKDILEIYEHALEICYKYNISMGPACHYCEDNTLKTSFR